MIDTSFHGSFHERRLSLIIEGFKGERTTMEDVNGKNRDSNRYKVECTECGQRIGAYIILRDGKLVGKVLYCVTRSYKRMVNVWDWTTPEEIGKVWYGEDDYTINDALRGIPFGDMVLPGKDSAQWYDNLRDAGYTVIYVI